MKMLHIHGVMNTHPAVSGGKGVPAGVALRQCLQQRPGLLQIGGVKALGEPAVDWRQQLARFGLLVLLLPQAAQASGRPQCESTGLLGPCYVEGLLEALFRLVYCRSPLLQ
jgi:hypothetical protein